MQLAQAIDAWVEAHGTSLSASTLRDIDLIAESIEACGWDELACDDVDREVREDIIEEATGDSTLGGSAISEFLRVVIQWSAGQTDEDNDNFDDNDDLSDDDEHDDDEHDHDDDDESNDDEDDDDDYDDDEDDDDDDDDDEDHDDDDDGDDDDDEDDDDEDDDGDDDDDDDDESDDDDDEPYEPLDAAASSFFEAIDASTPATDAAELDDIEILPAESIESTSGGVFSAAAEQVPSKSKSGVDWITVAYFTVAAICFALVIYFYLSS